MTHANDNPRTIPAVNDDDLPREYVGRIAIVIEVWEGDVLTANGIQMTLQQGVELLHALAQGEAA